MEELSKDGRIPSSVKFGHEFSMEVAGGEIMIPLMPRLDWMQNKTYITQREYML